MRKYRYVRKSHRYLFSSILLVMFALALLIGLLVANRSVDVFEQTYGKFKLLTVKEVFQYGLKTYTVQIPIFGTPRLIGFDSFRNRYTLYFENGKLIVEIGGQRLENPDEQYARLYSLALINIVEKNAPVEVFPAEQQSLFEYIPNGKFSYTSENDKDFVVYSGKRRDGRMVELWFTVERSRDAFKVRVAKAVLDEKILHYKELSALLAEIYKKNFTEDLVELVKSAYLKDVKDYTIGDLAQKLTDPRWYVKDEAGRIVELVFTEAVKGLKDKEPTTATVTIGFKLETIGEVSVQYVVLNNEEIPKERVANYVTYFFAKHFDDFRERESARIVGLIKNGVIQSHGLKIGELVNTTFSGQNWEVDFTPEGVSVTLTGTFIKENAPVRMVFFYDGKTALLQEVSMRKQNVASRDFLREALELYKEMISQREKQLTVEEEYIQRVQQTKLVRLSPYSNNKEAFERFLKNVTWVTKPEDKLVTVAGNGTYAGKFMRFEFDFDVSSVTPILKDLRIAGRMVDDTVADYIVGKIFLVPNYEYSILEYVKNYAPAMKTLREVFADGTWTVDVKNDLVNLRMENLSGTFVVEIDGSVRCVQLNYKGQNVSDRLNELVRALESGRSISEFFSTERPEVSQTPQVPRTQQAPQSQQSTQPPQSTPTPKNDNDKQQGTVNTSSPQLKTPESEKRNGKESESTSVEYGQF